MEINQLPKMNMDDSATKCCPKFNPEGWDNEKLIFQDKLFVKAKTISFLHFPLNMGPMYKKVYAKVEKEKGFSKEHYFVLSYDPSPWRGEHYFAVEKDIPGEEMVKLSGIYLTKVFEGPYKDVGKWVKQMKNYVESKGNEAKKIYFFYTTCPKCAKHYGKNYTIAIAQI